MIKLNNDIKFVNDFIDWVLIAIKFVLHAVS